MYYTPEEFGEIASIFDVAFDPGQPWRGRDWNWLGIARQLIEKLDFGNHRLLLESLLEQLDQRNKTAIARTDWERREAHQHAEPKIRRLIESLGEASIPREIAVAEAKPFSAKAEVREFLERAETEIFVVDPCIGISTLDCLRSVSKPIRLLTGTHPNSIEKGFDGALQAFRAEGFQVELRQNAKLHDRHIVFNDRCWLVGSSLKDAGKKAFHTTEIIDTKAEVIAALEAKWQASSVYP
jgi:hypothetical protein